MWRRYTEGIDGMEGVIEEFVAARRGEVDEHDDLLSILLSATDEADEAMSEELLRDELMTFLFAGHETTATALTFTWFLLARHPEVDRKLVAELDAVLDGEPPSFADLPDLEYTEQVLREAMWLYPPVPQIPRDTTEPVELGGYGIPEGATVAACQWTVRRDGSLWAYPHEFRPKRFETDDCPRFSHFPFGGGPRRCIGEQFAMVEGKLILATLARRYRLETVSDPDVDLPVSITTRPLDPIETRVEPRERGRSWPPAGSPPRPTTGRVPHPGTVAVLVGSRLKRPPPCRRGVDDRLAGRCSRVDSGGYGRHRRRHPRLHRRPSNGLSFSGHAVPESSSFTRVPGVVGATRSSPLSQPRGHRPRHGWRSP